MAKFEIITDYAADLYEGFYEETGIKRLPFSFTVDGNLYTHDEDYPLDKFYDALKNGSDVKTSQINPQVAHTVFDEVLASGNDLLYIGFSSGMSGSFDNISYIAKGLRIKYPERRVEVVDSLSGAGGEGLLVYYAYKMQQAGKSMDEIIEWIEQNRLNIHHVFIVDDLGNLRRSGRISTLSALFGMIVNIKPVLELTRQGKIGVLSKALGRKKATSEIVRFFKQFCEADKNDFVLVCHAGCEDDAKALGEQIASIEPSIPVKYGFVNRSVAGCAGYKALVAFFVGVPRKERNN